MVLGSARQGTCDNDDKRTKAETDERTVDRAEEKCEEK